MFLEHNGCVFDGGNHHGEIISGDEGKFHDGTPEPALIFCVTAPHLLRKAEPRRTSGTSWRSTGLGCFRSLHHKRSAPTEALRFEALARLTPTSGYGLGKFC